jgi:uncharacterized protein
MRTRSTGVAMICLFLALSAGIGLAQALYEDPQGRFVTPVPEGWTLSATLDVVTFERSAPDGTVHVLAPIGYEADVVAAALAILVDPALDAAFAAAPLQATPVPLPSGTWTQRIYQVGDEIVATISQERGGYTVLVLARATQEAFVEAVNAAVNQVLLGLAVLVEGPVAESDDELPFDVVEVSFASGDVTLAGALTVPWGDGPHPGLVVVSGSGAQDRDGRNPSLPGYTPLRWLAHHLTAAGFAVLRFDERGVGRSSGDHLSATSADLADDVAAGLRFLAGRDQVDAERVGLLGHSEGAVIVSRVAALAAGEVAFLVTMAAPALPYADVVLTQVARIAAAAGASEAELAAAVEQQRRAVELASDEAWDALETFMIELGRDQVAALPEAQRAQLGDTDAFIAQQAAVSVAMFQSPWMRFFLDYDPRDDLRRVTVPVLAIFAELDVQVDVDQNRPALEAALADAGNEDVTVLVFDGVNHLFQDAVTGNVDEYLVLEMAFAPGFLDTLSDWLVERFLP